MTNYCKIFKINSMKTLRNLIVLITIIAFTFSCTPTSLIEDEASNTPEVLATGENDGTDVDDDKD